MLVPAPSLVAVIGTTALSVPVLVDVPALVAVPIGVPAGTAVSVPLLVPVPVLVPLGTGTIVVIFHEPTLMRHASEELSVNASVFAIGVVVRFTRATSTSWIPLAPEKDLTRPTSDHPEADGIPVTGSTSVVMVMRSPINSTTGGDGVAPVAGAGEVDVEAVAPVVTSRMSG